MNSSFRLVELDVSFEKPEGPIDWSLCVLCQKETGEELVNPSQSKRAKKDVGYDTIERNLEEFRRLRKVPCMTPLASLSSGLGIKANLEKNTAVYHKTCFSKCCDSKLKKARLSDSENIPPNTPSPLPTRRSSGLSPSENNVCAICGQRGTNKWPLQRVNYEKGGLSMKEAAIKKLDTNVLVMLQGNEMWCHNKCRSSFKYQKVDSGTSKTFAEATEKSLRHVVEHILNAKESSTESPVFTMAQITKLYTSKMLENGVETSGHSSRLKEQLLRECPYLEASGTAGQSCLITFKQDVDIAIRASTTTPDLSVIGQAAREVRRDLFAATGGSVPASITNLVSLIVDGQSIDEGQEPDEVISNIAQLLFFHARKVKGGKHRRHNSDRETPAVVYLSMKLFGETRSKHLVDTVYQLGYGISYDRVTTILKEKAAQACTQYKEDGAVCPVSLEFGAFTTAAVDNIDHDTTSMTCRTSFHGTAISLSQHGPRGVPRQLAPSQPGVIGLPDDYIVVPPSFLDEKLAKCPQSAVSRAELPSDSDPCLQEREWLESCRESSTTDTWPAHHSKQVSAGAHVTRQAVLPLFRDKSASLAMMAHSMRIAIKSIRHLNSSQVPVLVADQPLYALLKKLQWLLPDQFGEDIIYIMLGPMHTELAAMKALGHWLSESGWTSALVEAGITSSGRAEAMLTVNHLTRTRYAHQVTAAVLYSLKWKAYAEQASDDPLTFEQWCEEKRSSIPQFRFWDVTLAMELNVLQLVRSLRTADFPLFNSALTRLAPFFFALDHQNYSRWLSVHIRDNISLETRHPTLWQQFLEGNFVADKSGRLFSKIALDQAHEQINALLKGSGGMIGLTEDPAALHKWILYAPEVADLTNEYESSHFSPKANSSGLHHFDSSSSKSLFLKDKLALEAVFEKAGNPFAEESKELYNIDTRKCYDDGVIHTVMNVECIGVDQYVKFTKERLETAAVSIHAPIPRNNLPTFGKPSQPSQPTKSKQKIKALKKDVNLFSRMWVAISNNRPGDLEEFFAHENQDFPPALATLEGSLRASSKEDLVNGCLAPLATSKPDRMPSVDVKVMDGPALAHLLRPGLSVVFSDYRDKVFLPFIIKEAENVARVDIVWDVYRERSLKALTRDKRGEGPKVLVEKDTKIPRDWRTFLRNSENKDQLFGLLADAIPNCADSGAEIYATKGANVVTNCGRLDLSDVAPCNHEEADTRIFVHVADAVRRGATRVLIRASDTDVVALACACLPQIPSLKELWVHRATSKDNRFIAVHEISAALGPSKSLVIPALHAFTGCDTVDAFFGIGKKTAFNALSLQPEAVQALLDLSEGRPNNTQLEKLVIAMYSPGKKYDTINKCRRGLFASSNRPLESIPPTQDAFNHHSLRASIQAQVWRQILVTNQTIPLPSEWGWQNINNVWLPVWTTNPKCSTKSLTLVSCKCKKSCTGNCSCKTIGCCDLCKCPCNND